MQLPPGNVKGEVRRLERVKTALVCRCVPAGERADRQAGRQAGWGYLLGVGSVPEDGVSVGHHLGSRVLAVHTHPNDEDEEEDHFHLRHICSGTPMKSN